MIGLLRQSAKAALVAPPAWMLANRLRPAGVTVLMYHRIVADEDPAGITFEGMPAARFKEQMEWLARRCRPIGFREDDDGIDAALRSRGGKPPILVTFDDGYRDYHDVAYPILRQLGIPSIVFLATRFIDEGGLIWTDALRWAVLRSPCSDMALPWSPGAHVPLSDLSTRHAAIRTCKEHLKSVDDASRQAALAALYRALEVDPSVAAAGRQMLNWDEVRACLDGTHFGGHTHTHPILSRLSEPDMEREIALCRDRIVAETSVVPRCFAYPNGRAQDFTPATQRLLERHGFRYGFSTIEGVHRLGNDRYAIHRQPTGGSTLADFAWLVGGFAR